MNLYNTLTKKKEPLPSPANHPTISMYSCGPTVYDDTHLGHMRRYVMDDVLKRSLRFLGYDVKHVMNITDVGHLTGDDDSGEDKLEKGAKKVGKTVWDVAAEYEEQFWHTMHVLNVKQDDIIVLHATKCVGDMIKLIKKLEQKGFTYETDEALYFDVTKFSHYGKLSSQNLEDKKQAVRDEVYIDKNKKHPADFALWFKRVGRFTNHTMHWESPWGTGFPGWHIECSAMSMKGLHAQTIDIHTGGIDHIPLHHENEIAQSEGATGKQFVKYWMHHAFLQVDGQKMSKSKHNFYTLHDIVSKGIDPLALRYLFLQTHYRKPMNFTWEAAKGAQKTLEDLYERATVFAHNLDYDPKTDHLGSEVVSAFALELKSAIANDLNTPKVIGDLHNALNHAHDDTDVMQIFTMVDDLLGVDFKKNGLRKMNDKQTKIPEKIILLAQKRQQARQDNDFKTSDKLRDDITKLGYIIEDNDKGYTVRKK